MNATAILEPRLGPCPHRHPMYPPAVGLATNSVFIAPLRFLILQYTLTPSARSALQDRNFKISPLNLTMHCEGPAVASPNSICANPATKRIRRTETLIIVKECFAEQQYVQGWLRISMQTDSVGAGSFNSNLQDCRRSWGWKEVMVEIKPKMLGSKLTLSWTTQQDAMTKLLL